MAVDIVREGFARNALDDVARNRRAVVGVGAFDARVADAGGDVVLEEGAERNEAGRALHRDAAPVFKTRRVGEKVADEDRLRVCGGNLEVEIFVDVVVQLHTPLFDLLHQRGPREQL